MNFPKGLALALALLLLMAVAPSTVQAQVSCTLIIDADSGDVVQEAGDCDTRVTPASTFKLPLAVIGFDTGLLTSATTPVYSYATGDPDWGGPDWTRDTDPRRWMRYSVLWYSQRMTRALGADVLGQALTELNFGNADVSGGIETAWLGSSLQVSAREQAVFLRKLVTGQLPVTAQAMLATRDILHAQFSEGWRIQGKTGGAFEGQTATGWFVGWASKEGRVLVFVRLHQAPEQTDVAPGRVQREAFIAQWPSLIAGQP